MTAATDVLRHLLARRWTNIGRQLTIFTFKDFFNYVFSFLETLKDLYLIWKLRSLAKIWYPIEVAEVEIAASASRN